MGQSDDMAAFVRILERGGFAAAARGSPLTPSALSKLVARLEARLGVRLLTRTTRRIAPTPEGEVYAARAREVLALIDATETEVTASRGRPRGHLRVNTSTAYARHRLVPLLAAFRAEYPEITLDLTVTDRRVDLVREGLDVLVRTGAPVDTSLVARRIAQGRRVICASPAYLARRGTPQRPADLAAHDCIVLEGPTRMTAWPFREGGGVVALHVGGPLSTDSIEALSDMALAGLGIIRVSEFVVREAIAEGRLMPLLEDAHAREEVPIWALTAPGRHRLPRIRAFVDFLARSAPA